MWSAIPSQDTGRKRLGLIVNPIAGIGGRVGLKGSDGLDIQRMALELGAVPEAGDRARCALDVLRRLVHELDILTPPGEMGETIARQCGFDPLVIGSITPGATTTEDTRRAAKAMQLSAIDLLLFAGGDGTARDIFSVVGSEIPVLGIPAGVKIHSAVFATNPHNAGALALEFLRSKTTRVREAEVVDQDEQAYRSGNVAIRLYGFLKIPYRRQMVQNQKVPTPDAEASQADAIAADVIDGMQGGWLYILGPGTIPRTIAYRLGMPKTLVGVDVVTSHALIAQDVSENQLLALIENRPAKIIITPIGGQGFLFGRGNQQISPRVIQKVGKENIMVVCQRQKLNALRGKPFLVDTGDPQTDKLLTGYVSVITGYHERSIYRVTV